MSITDRRDEMTLPQLVDELEMRFPEKVADFENRYPDAMHAVSENPDGVSNDEFDCDWDELDELADDIRALLRV